MENLNYHKPISAGQKLRLMAIETMQAIYNNFRTQCISPHEPYAGFMAKNAAAKAGSWKSTGDGFDSFTYQVNDVQQPYDIDARLASMEFFYNYYLNFVDMGVGMHRPIEKVYRTTDADFGTRYMEWNSKSGSTQRPAIMMEFRHQTRRMERYWINRYKYTAQVGLIQGLEGVTGVKK